MCPFIPLRNDPTPALSRHWSIVLLISVEQANRGACDACGRIVWAIDFESLPGVTVRLEIHHDFGGEQLIAFSYQVDPEHTALAVQNVMKPYEQDGPPYILHSQTPEPENVVPASVALTSPARTDEALRQKLKQHISDWEDDGVNPSISRVKRALRVGDDRALRLLNAVQSQSD